MLKGFVIKRIGDGLYVAKPGSEKSYTNRLENARIYPTASAASADRCVENEQVYNILDLLGTLPAQEE